jgi:hypothetical protein
VIAKGQQRTTVYGMGFPMKQHLLPGRLRLAMPVVDYQTALVPIRPYADDYEQALAVRVLASQAGASAVDPSAHDARFRQITAAPVSLLIGPLDVRRLTTLADSSLASSPSGTSSASLMSPMEMIFRRSHGRAAMTRGNVHTFRGAIDELNFTSTLTDREPSAASPESVQPPPALRALAHSYYPPRYAGHARY